MRMPVSMFVNAKMLVRMFMMMLVSVTVRLAGGRVVFVIANGEVLAEVNGKQFGIEATLLATELTESDGFE